MSAIELIVAAQEARLGKTPVQRLRHADRLGAVSAFAAECLPGGANILKWVYWPNISPKTVNCTAGHSEGAASGRQCQRLAEAYRLFSAR